MIFQLIILWTDFDNMIVFLFQSAKVFNYAKWETTTNIIFVFFAVVFNATRLVYYPFW